MGVHFSQSPNLKVIRANKWNAGGGLQGAERSRAEAYPEDFVNKRIYFYIASSKYSKEPGLGNNKYQVLLHNLYDWDNDPSGFFKKATLIAHARYVQEQKHLMKLVGVDDPEIDPEHYDYNLATTIMEGLVKKAGFNGYYSYASNNNIVYF